MYQPVDEWEGEISVESPVNEPAAHEPLADDPSKTVNSTSKRPRRKRQPPKPKHNPFSRSRPNQRPLLRSLLDNEVKVTLSNLSQAIRFIVANDCLKNVELKPGDAVFARPPGGKEDGRDDVLQILVLEEYVVLDLRY